MKEHYLAFFVVILLVLIPEENCLRRRRRRQHCNPINCQVSGWSPWTRCTQDCGPGGQKTRTRHKTVVESCGGRCSHGLSETISCNRFCFNGGTLFKDYCLCKHGYTGRCCEHGPPPTSCSPTNCQVSGWSPWSPCSQVCGNGGLQTRTRRKIVVESCNGVCHHGLTETMWCNRYCLNGGTPLNGYCGCKYGLTGRCCEVDQRAINNDNNKNNNRNRNRDKNIQRQKDSSNDPKAKSPGEIAGIVFGSIAGVLLVIILCVVGIKCCPECVACVAVETCVGC